MPLTEAALVVVDVQAGFDDPSWGRRNNPSCEENLAVLLGAWHEAKLPIVLVHHDSTDPRSPLAVGSAGNHYKRLIDPTIASLSISKQVHSAFYGEPDLHAWLQERGVRSVAVCGITTDHCCETTTRMAGDLGYDTYLVLDATHTFDRRHPDGSEVDASTADVIGELQQTSTQPEAQSKDE